MKSTWLILLALAIVAVTASAEPNSWTDMGKKMAHDGWGDKGKPCCDGGAGLCDTPCGSQPCGEKCFEKCLEKCTIFERCDLCGKIFFCDGYCNHCGKECHCGEYCTKCGYNHDGNGIVDGVCDKCGEKCNCYEHCDQCLHSHLYDGCCDLCGMGCLYDKYCVEHCHDFCKPAAWKSPGKNYDTEKEYKEMKGDLYSAKAMTGKAVYSDKMPTDYYRTFPAAE
jgi:hypothetical protein